MADTLILSDVHLGSEVSHARQAVRMLEGQAFRRLILLGDIFSDLNFRRLAILATAATYVMMLTGSTVVASGADDSCNSWPLCGGGFALDFTGANAFTMLHRGTVLVVGLLLLQVLSTAFIRWRSVRGMGPIAIGAIIALVLQIGVGAGSAITGNAVFDGLHVAIATLVWSGVLATTLLTFPRADKNLELSRLEVDRRSP